jgi:hypothetical protein
MLTLTLPRVRAKIQAGQEEYQMASGDMPSFLFEEPEKYDTKEVLAGFMRGFFLACVHIHTKHSEMRY